MKKIVALALLLLTACQGSNHSEETVPAGQEAAVVGGYTVVSNGVLKTKVLSLGVAVKNVDGGLSASQCTASALTSRLIITAAHCISANAVHTQVELRDNNNKIVPFKAEKAFVHAGYAKDKQNDLALLLLEKPLPAGIRKLSLPYQWSVLLFDQILAAGYGKDNGVQGEKYTLGVLRVTNIPVLEFDKTKKTFVVDQRKGHGICQGDSGGPAMVTKDGIDYIVGVVSKTVYQLPETIDGVPDFCNYKGVYVNIQQGELRKWIIDTSNQAMLTNAVNPALAVTYDYTAVNAQE
ncbi:trypsin-like serine protease [Bdellovibrio sp. NC01]|uniref:trypsin-like serine protease n=1 Tax=Bdellovibrio sp. NC01 TaxID=2220073 RepID=UPI00115ADBEF|nr:trypsin-like serine protease [Bdellovibrio sp. NC01]QDK39128.1 hypothetical protein DOE51_16810 [Bdellovibrio sp. NC01]